jgi:hypothetical protein
MNRLILPVLLLLAGLSACTVYNEYPIEVYKPGEVAVPPSAENVALFYRNFKYPADTMLHYYKRDYQLIKAQNDPENLDSILVFTCLNELAQEFKTSNTFSEVRIFPYSSFDRHSADNLPQLPAELISKIASSSGSDVLIALETFSAFFSSYPEEFETPETNEVITASVWGIYDADTEKLMERKTFIDTLFWNGYDNQGKYMEGYQPPPRLNALQIAAAMAGENYAKRFRASWETVNRLYSVPPLPDFSDAAYYFEEGDWDRAIALWKKYAGDNDGKLAINARYNLALAYELKDQIATAEKWLDAAYDLATSYRSKDDLKRIVNYQKALDTRKKQINRLNQYQDENPR